LLWPEPQSTSELKEMLEHPVPMRVHEQEEFSLAVHEKADRKYAAQGKSHPVEATLSPDVLTDRGSPADELFAKVRDLLRQMPTPKTAEEIAADLDIPTGLAKKWLDRLAKESTLMKLKKPVRYQSIG
jgi:hypothetical protein